MDDDRLNVKLFGEMALGRSGKTIRESDNRSKKSWLLMAYLLYNRSRNVSQKELIRLLWETDDQNSNPNNALKTLLHRTRSMVNELGDQFGHSLIQFKNGMYSIDSSVTVVCDVDLFEKALRSAQDLPDSERADAIRTALDYYSGDFLSGFSMEQWVVPINVYYHDVFVEASSEAASLLYDAGRYEESRDVCLRAIDIEQYDEGLYLLLLQDYKALDNKKELIAAYEKLKSILYSNFGTLPDEECSKLYREACNTVSGSSLAFEEVLEQITEHPGDSAHKAVVCEYDLFRLLYRVVARQVVRSGDVIHISMFTVKGRNGKDIVRSSLDKVMDNFEAELGANLRAGDIISRCSSTQFVVMLPQSNYENSQMVSKRLIAAYHRKYPHAPAEIDFEVRGIEPKF